jgi:hypothetical protein
MAKGNLLSMEHTVMHCPHKAMHTIELLDRGFGDQ